MSQSNWPEPTRDESEPPRWGGVAAAIALAAISAYIIFRDTPGSSEPTLRLPQIALRGREEPLIETAPAANEDLAALSPDLLAADADGAITRPAAYKDCLAVVYDTGNAVGVEPVLEEQNADRTIARLPLQDGGVTITCSARDGTMTIEHAANERP